VWPVLPYAGIGLTATPFTKGLGKYWDVLINAATTHQLINEGWLSPYRIFSASTPDMTGVPVVKGTGEWEEREAERRVMPIVGDCVAEYLRLGEGRKFIAFAVSVAHAEELKRKFMAAGIIAELYTYQQGDAERQESVREFRKPDSYIRGLISIEALTRGFDVPDIGVLILARPLRKSLAVHIQMVGRVLRVAEDKQYATILDHAGNCSRFWHQQTEYMDNGWQELDDGTRKPKSASKEKVREPRTCPKCAAVHRPCPMCPHCGYEYPRRSKVEHVAGELSELSGRDSTQAQRRSLYAQLLWVAAQRGYASGWAAHQYRNRVGHWPNGMMPTPEPATPELESWVRSQMIRYYKSRKRSRVA
jgi:DNA repair protein RadD